MGDAGHFKDPTPGQGISDALRQAERLASVVLETWGAAGAAPPAEQLDRPLARWWRWRDRDAREMPWFAQDLGGAGAVPAVFVEMIRKLAAEPDGLRLALDVINHRVRPSELLTPTRLAGGALRAITGGHRPGPVLRELRTIGAREVGRRWRNHRPRYVDESPVEDPDPAAPSLR